MGRTASVVVSSTSPPCDSGHCRCRSVLYFSVSNESPLVHGTTTFYVGSTPARDAIVVFAGGVGESGQTGGGYQERVREAVELYQAGFAPRMIFSSGYEFAFREAEVMRSLAMSQGVPASAIVLETRASSTYENVVFVYELLEEHESNTPFISK
ncbi:MAG: hypothetical protein Ct9H300mP25_01660 [Acidobacteriota bacterium]|nr:MAG: hypothetical protein Ct9H300mP25_01660 [Acidobacteriota bacterium]